MMGRLGWGFGVVDKVEAEDELFLFVGGTCYVEGLCIS